MKVTELRATPATISKGMFKLKHIKGEQNGPHLLILGGVHGDEFEGMTAVRRLIGRMSRQPFRGTLTLVPLANESAWRRGDNLAEDDLNLARVCPGKPDGSVTQRTAHALSELIRTADYLIDFHSGGTFWDVFPFAGYFLHDDPQVLASQRHMARAFGLPMIWGTSPSLDGRTISVARDAGIPAIYLEWHGRAVCDPAGVEAFVAGSLNVMAKLNMIAPVPEASRPPRIIEDPRPGSGHMHVQNPSPMEGFFEPAVCVGRTVNVDDLIGRVIDAMGDRVEPIHAAQTGLVIMLRTFPRVFEGDALAVVAEERPFVPPSAESRT